MNKMMNGRLTIHNLLSIRSLKFL